MRVPEVPPRNRRRFLLAVHLAADVDTVAAAGMVAVDTVPGEDKASSCARLGRSLPGLVRCFGSQGGQDRGDICSVAAYISVGRRG